MNDTVLPHPALVERLIALARRLKSIHRPAEAAELLEIASALSPQGQALREEALRLRQEEGLEDFDREFKRRNLEASHALGMAHIFESREELSRAVEMIDLAKLRTPFSYLAYAAAAFLHLRHEDTEAALQEFSQARRLNPLDYRLAVETSRAALETEDFDNAIEHAVDAMLLANWRSEREQDQERRRVDTLARLCQLSTKKVQGLVKKRAAALQKASDHVALSHARIFSGTRLKPPKAKMPAPAVPKVADNLLERATELRTMSVLRHLPDDQLITMARLFREEQFDHAHIIFREDEPGRDLYLIRNGTVHITRKTPVGTQILTTLGVGAMFGEVSYLDDSPRSATAFGVGNGSLFVLPGAELDAEVQADRELAVSLLWGFWQTLAEKVRAANAQMSELFSVPGGVWQSDLEKTEGQRVHLTEKDKLDLLREQGLSAQELRLLATFSKEEKFEGGSVLFAEGQPGDSLYIVVDGSVRISRIVPGIGEECLAILERGEVFGEMALIDEQPRSADARAHQGETTVFSVSRSLLEEVLSMDPDAAVQFLTLLCRLMCRRLRAMNERLVAWRVMAGHE
jgi:CRP-like cAMP-binding protein